ncbi:TniQ family protein [Frateuria sp.]|uniref:TniQ family protein n=1 Tax=Frateuria sp. TaxID=2211372 RepID=UPI0039C8600C
MLDKSVSDVDKAREKWTVLPPLELRGVGTPLVESLQSFISRVLATTGMGSKRLAKGLSLKMPSKLIRMGGFSRSNGPDVLELAVDELQSLTGADNLRSGTFWALSKILTADNQSINEKCCRRWCPNCYKEWGPESYEPLAWTVDLLRTCPVHGCLLNNACWSCERPQRPYLDASRRSSCTNCGADLSRSVRWVELHPFLRSVERQVLDLIEFCAESRTEPVPYDVLREFIQGLRRSAGSRRGDILAKQIKQFASCAKLRRRRVSLRSLINLCAIQGVSVSEFLAAPRATSSPLLFDRWGGLTYMPLPTARQAQKIYVASQCMKAYLRERPAYLPPISVFLSRFNVQLLAVRDVAEETYDFYLAAHSVHGDAATQRALRAAYLSATSILAARTQGEPLDAEVVAAMVMRRTEVGLSIARHAVKSAALVRATQAEEVISCYEREMTLDEALDWFVENRQCSRNADGVPPRTRNDAPHRRS